MKIQNNKNKLINICLFLFISFLCIESLFSKKLHFINGRISIVEILFIILASYTALRYYKILYIFCTDLKNYRLFDYILFIVLFIRILKFSFNSSSSSNLYEILLFIYMISIFFITKFLLFNFKNIKTVISNSFISLSFLISLFVFISFFLYLIKPNILEFIYSLIQNKNIPLLWEVKDGLHYPIFGQNSVHFFGFVYGQNQAAFLLIPGFFIFLNKYKLNRASILVSFIILFISFLFIKAKIIILVIGFTIFYFFINTKKLKKKFISLRLLIIYFSFTVIIYGIFTHILILDKYTINDTNKHLFDYYYTANPLFTFFDYNFYGSLFLKLKIIALQLSKENYFLLFDGINILEYNLIYENYPSGHDISSEYFSVIANYGFVVLILYLIIIFYFFVDFFKKYSEENYLNENLGYLIVVAIFVIEGLLTEFLHFQQIWIIYAYLYYNKYSKN